MIIAIDGPSGSGKSTLGRMLAHALKLLYLDTGSMYRAVALAVIEAHVDPTDKSAVTALATSIDIDLRGDPDSLVVLLDGRDVTDEIRTESVTETSSIVSTIPGVGRAMVERQRALGEVQRRAVRVAHAMPTCTSRNRAGAAPCDTCIDWPGSPFPQLSTPQSFHAGREQIASSPAQN